MKNCFQGMGRAAFSLLLGGVLIAPAAFAQPNQSNLTLAPFSVRFQHQLAYFRPNLAKMRSETVEEHHQRKHPTVERRIHVLHAKKLADEGKIPTLLVQFQGYIDHLRLWANVARKHLDKVNKDQQRIRKPHLVTAHRNMRAMYTMPSLHDQFPHQINRFHPNFHWVNSQVKARPAKTEKKGVEKSQDMPALTEQFNHEINQLEPKLHPAASKERTVRKHVETPVTAASKTALRVPALTRQFKNEIAELEPQLHPIATQELTASQKAASLSIHTPAQSPINPVTLPSARQTVATAKIETVRTYQVPTLQTQFKQEISELQANLAATEAKEVTQKTQIKAEESEADHTLAQIQEVVTSEQATQKTERALEGAIQELQLRAKRDERQAVQPSDIQTMEKAIAALQAELKTVEGQEVRPADVQALKQTVSQVRADLRQAKSQPVRSAEVGPLKAKVAQLQTDVQQMKKETVRPVDVQAMRADINEIQMKNRQDLKATDKKLQKELDALEVQLAKASQVAGQAHSVSSKDFAKRVAGLEGNEARLQAGVQEEIVRLKEQAKTGQQTINEQLVKMASDNQKALKEMRDYLKKTNKENQAAMERMERRVNMTLQDKVRKMRREVHKSVVNNTSIFG